MSQVRAAAVRRAPAPAGADLTLTEALRRTNNPRIAESLSVLYAQLARAQTDHDRQAVRYIRDTIAEAMRGVPDGEIDEPLIPSARRRRKSAR